MRQLSRAFLLMACQKTSPKRYAATSATAFTSTACHGLSRPATVCHGLPPPATACHHLPPPATASLGLPPPAPACCPLLQILEEHESCGADEVLPTRLKDDSDSEDDSEDDDGSSDGDSTTQPQPRHPNRAAVSQHAAPTHTLEERELRNRPIAESVIQHSVKTLA